jgi:hypothetical protein
MDEVTLLRLLRARDAIHVRYSEPLQLGALAREAALRRLTVAPKAQPDFEIVLMKVAAGPMLDESRAAQIRMLVEAGSFGCGVLESTDVRADYEELSKKGVRFFGPPQDRPYGIETILQDDSGNWFSLTQRKR